MAQESHVNSSIFENNKDLPKIQPPLETVTTIEKPNILANENGNENLVKDLSFQIPNENEKIEANILPENTEPQNPIVENKIEDMETNVLLTTTEEITADFKKVNLENNSTSINSINEPNSQSNSFSVVEHPIIENQTMEEDTKPEETNLQLEKQNNEPIKTESNSEPIQESQRLLGTEPENVTPKSEALERAESTFKSIMGTFSNETDVTKFIKYMDTILKDHGISIFEHIEKPKKKTPSTSQPKEKEKIPKPKFQKRKISGKKYETDFLLTNPDSILTQLNLKEILNVKSFNLLSPVEKDQLLQYLPNIDCTNKKSIESTFTSNAFHQSLQSFQEMLEAGEFEEGSDYLSYLKGKKKREKSETWKEKYYEEYWGQRSELHHEFADTGDYGTKFSFVEYAKDHPEEQAPISEPIVLGKVVENPVQHIVEDVLDLDFVYDESEDEFVDPTAKRKRKYQPEPEEEEEEEEDDEEIIEEKTTKKRKSLDGAKSFKGDSFKMTAYTILKREGKPLSAGKIVKIGLKEGLMQTTGKTPQNTLASVIYCEIKKDPTCPFVKVAPMTFGLKEWGNEKPVEMEDAKSAKKRRKKKKNEDSSE